MENKHVFVAEDFTLVKLKSNFFSDKGKQFSTGHSVWLVVDVNPHISPSYSNGTGARFCWLVDAKLSTTVLSYLSVCDEELGKPVKEGKHIVRPSLDELEKLNDLLSVSIQEHVNFKGNQAAILLRAYQRQALSKVVPDADLGKSKARVRFTYTSEHSLNLRSECGERSVMLAGDTFSLNRTKGNRNILRFNSDKYELDDVSMGKLLLRSVLK